ncbi:hypothetical protein WA026_007144 [Henosepilachna vigintioctopunctata]|uniref:Uncharacterized protein n=1 Tax=Henosepilachna vigintioctopunctata TaxID=420089 RepID=A0AAW1V3V7_9CUCU
MAGRKSVKLNRIKQYQPSGFERFSGDEKFKSDVLLHNVATMFNSHPYSSSCLFCGVFVNERQRDTDDRSPIRLKTP